ncbi:hypothetical protein J1605_014747 [Eschrichtius robustus]|uniref:Uncharacterized protein n=1 Tax=Eschrichtius robustus TaxID=9764 RepID=A0AB34GG66_ESCRO|nr:hypothetical protein J1605_014747 [Eschrichtius robustus]
MLVGWLNDEREREESLTDIRKTAEETGFGQDYAILIKTTGQWAVLKSAAASGATPIAGHFTPGNFTNQIQAAFWELQLPVVTDPRACPACLWVKHTLLCTVWTLPSHTWFKGTHSVHLMRWMPAGEVLRLRSAISREHPRKVTPALLLLRP